MAFHFFQDEFAPILVSETYLQIGYLRSKGLLKRSYDCPSCQVETQEIKTSRNIDGFIFQCRNKTCECFEKYFSIRVNSFFARFKISLKNCLFLIWKWANDDSQESSLREVNVSRSVILKFYSELRKLCGVYFRHNPVFLGGEGIICQIDESLFRHKPKYHTGRAADYQIWVFGICDTSYSPGKVFLRVVEQRNANTLIPLINQVCRPGTILISDEWAAYNSLYSSDFGYLSVNHSLNFVDPVTLAHTQNIESFWSKAKLKIKKMKGIYGCLIPEFLNELMFRVNIFRDDFQAVVDLIKFYG